MRQNPLVVVVLAAGEGTRMRSKALPKVLHGFAGRSMLGHVLASTAPLEPDQTVVVVGHRRDEVTAHLSEISPDAVAVVQDEQNGTGHATRLALAPVDAELSATVLVLPGDAPLLRPETLEALVQAHETSGAAATILSTVVDDPTGYGRILRAADDSITGIVEHKDATADELLVNEIGTAIYAFDHAALRDAVGRLSTDNAQGEEYLPDVIAIFVADGRKVAAVTAPAAETAGVNDRVQLAAAHRVYNDRLIESHQRNGVSVVDPATTWVDATVTIDADAIVLPGTDLHGATHIRRGAVVGPQCSLTDTSVGEDATLDRVVAKQATIGARVTIGPFAYLRPGTALADDVHIGTYVEVKNSEIGEGTKVPHLTYVGDATIGHHTNIGAATVFVNYDGVAKHRSVIGNHARTGADNMFVAPVNIGDGVYTGAGAVITGDVPPGALARSSARQQNVAGWVAQKRPGTAAAEAAAEANKVASETNDEDEA